MISWPKENADDYIQEIVELHFGSDGSEYCNDLKSRFPNIDFKKDIQTPEDRIHLPIETDELVRSNDFQYFIPRKILKENRELYFGTSSGTNGPKKNIPWLKGTFNTMMDWFEWNFSFYKIDRSKDILSYGPSGLFQQAMNALSERLNVRNFHVTNDDLGELKKLFADESIREEIARLVYERDLLPIIEKEEAVGNIISLGPIIYQIDPDTLPSYTSFFIGGFGVSQKEYENLKVKYKGRTLKEFYGNIFWTWSFSPGQEGYLREFFPPYPYVMIDIMDSQTGKMSSYDERGQVVGTRFTQDMFFRWKERDSAYKIRPKDQFTWNGVRNVGPL